MLIRSRTYRPVLIPPDIQEEDDPDVLPTDPDMVVLNEDLLIG